MTAVAQFTLEQAEWLPMWPSDEDALKLGQTFWQARILPRPTVGTSEDRRFRRGVEILRQHGWPIVARKDGNYVLSFAVEDLDKLEHDLRGRALSTLRTYNRVKRIRERRAA